jgi:hypothetical protein
MAQLPWQPGFEPKRDHKFILELANVAAYFITDVTIPQPQITDSAVHNFLSHKFKFPGKLTWGDSVFTLVDPIDLNAASLLMQHIKGAGYAFPSSFEYNDPASQNYYLRTIKKSGPADPNKNILNKLSIVSLTSDGQRIESWKLQNAFVKNVDFGKYDYNSESLKNVKISVSLDWVDYQNFGDTGTPAFNTAGS